MGHKTVTMAKSTFFRRALKRLLSRASESTMERYALNEKGKVLVEGRAIGGKIGAGQRASGQ